MEPTKAQTYAYFKAIVNWQNTQQIDSQIDTIVSKKFVASCPETKNIFFTNISY